MERPKHLTWEESACYMLVLATAYRMLFGHRPHVIRPGQNVLVWGASGGLGSMAVQLIATSGANAIGVVSEDDKRDFVMQLGARGVINRKKFNCWGELPKVGTPEYDAWFKEARKFGAAIWEITGKGNNVDFVFEHPGAATFPVSVLVVKRGGMVVICAGTTGYNLTMDARYLWMHQKRVQGSHFANLLQAAQANKLVVERRIDPCMSEVFPWEQIPKAHMRMWKNEHKPGNMAVLVNAPTHRPAHLRGRHRGEPQALRLRRGSPQHHASRHTTQLGGVRHSLNAAHLDVAITAPSLGYVERQLHAQQMVHVWSERLLDAQRHVCGQRGLLIEQIVQRLARHAQRVCRVCNGKAEWLNDLGADEAADVRRIVHGHRRLPFSDSPPGPSRGRPRPRI